MIKKRRLPLFHLIIISLAFLGLGYTFFNEPLQFLKNIFLFVGITAVVLGLFYFFVTRKRHQNDELRKYRKAVKQSKKRQKNNSSQITRMKSKKIAPLAKKKRENPPHLRVIDGKKSSQKNKLPL